MKTRWNSFLKKWFEIRIFISLSIVSIVTLLSFTVFRQMPSDIEIAGKWAGCSPGISLRYGYILVAFMVLSASLIRMWSGTILTSSTVMDFKVRDDRLMLAGPYKIVRHPIYSADLLAFTSLSLCLSPVGLLIPLLIRLHYQCLIRYEEETLVKKFGDARREYISSVPALLPGLRGFPEIIRDFRINYDGFRHNAQYILFIPGLIVAAFTGKFIHAILIGFPAAIDWAIVHTIKGIPKRDHPKASAKSRKFSRSKVFRDILYSQCWEDPGLDRRAFRIQPDDVVFTITSGGCNALAFLLDNPKKVICLDMNRHQNYLLSLKLNAFKTLTYQETLEFFGIRPSSFRKQFYDRIRPSLSEEEQLYWSNRKACIRDGIIHAGRYEWFMHLLMRLFRLLIGKKIIAELFSLKTVPDRQRFFDTKWNNKRWRVFCSLFLSRTFASLLFDKKFYKFIEPGFSFRKYYNASVRRAITELPIQENNFLAYILLGNYNDGNLPVYLKKENFDIIRTRVDRLEMVTEGCMDYFNRLPADSISKFNFTNIFEWMHIDEYTRLLRETVRVGTDKAVLTYRNHLVSRSRPESLSESIIPDPELSSELHKGDLSFIYKAYIVERIRKSYV